jgi:hypothetical protein
VNIKAAETQLQELGITDPSDIDVNAIAFHLGATIKYKSLSGCEASIVGVNDKAIIRVDPSVSPERQRFSAAHECGHWTHHRGRSFRCRSSDIENPRTSIANPERVADDYAADLLMPRYIFEPIANTFQFTRFSMIEEIGKLFGTSFLATALRIVKLGPEYSILICHGRGGREWFRRTEKMETFWFPQDRLDTDSVASDILSGIIKDKGKRMKMDGDAWFSFENSDRYEVNEESIPYGEKVLTLLTCKEF